MRGFTKKHWRPLAALLFVLAAALAAGIASVRGSSSSPAAKVTGKGPRSAGCANAAARLAAAHTACG